MWPHELKLRRARQHFQELELEIDRWLHVDGCAITVERDGNKSGYVVRAQRLRELDLEDLALKVGDVLQNARASLDYLAHELGDIGAGWGGMTSEESENSQFPIVSDVDKDGYSGLGLDRFRERITSDLSTLTPEAVAFIEGEQPFQQGEVWDMDHLWTLQELARIDRHRFLHVAVVRSGDLRRDASKWSNARIKGGDIDVVTGPCYFGDDEDPAERIGEPENSAVLARFTAEPTNPRKEMHMHFLNALTIGWDMDTSPVRLDYGVTDTLKFILNRVQTVFMNARPHLVRPEPPRFDAPSGAPPEPPF